MKQLIENVMIVTMDADKKIIDSGYLLIENKCFKEVGEGPYPGDKTGINVINAQGNIVVPGLINAHTHSYSNMVKGTSENVPLEIWMLYAMAEGRHMNHEDHALSAALGSIEMLKSGTTTFLDHLAQDEEGLTQVAEQYKKVGIRCLLTPMYGDRSYADSLPEPDVTALGTTPHSPSSKSNASWQEIIDMVESVIINVRDEANGISVAVGPSGPQRSSDELLVASMDLAIKYDLPFHTHLLETKAQEATAYRLYGKSMVEHLHDLNLLNERVSFAHGIWISEADMHLIKESGSSIVHNPPCNLAIGSGILQLIPLKEAGVRLALGTDGSNAGGYQSMFESMKLAAILSKNMTPDFKRWLTADDVLEMATWGSAKAVGMSDEIGSIEVGKKADFSILNQKTTNFAPLNNLIWQLVYGRADLTIDAVYVDGKQVVDKGEVLHQDEESIYREATERGVYLMRKLEEDYRLIEREHPRFYEMLMRVAEQPTNKITTN